MGDSFLIATRDDGVVDTANGTIDLVVFFGAGSVEGDMNLASKAPSGGSNFEIGNVAITIPTTSFSGTNFTAPLDVTTNSANPNPDGSNQLGIDPARSTGTLNGSFFGATGKSVGGDFQVFGPTPADTNSVVVQGGFIAKE